jgi:hypothetical protein
MPSLYHIAEDVERLDGMNREVVTSKRAVSYQPSAVSFDEVVKVLK